MPDVALTSVDLAAGIKLKVLYLPKTEVDVVIKSAPGDLLKAVKADKLDIQPVIEAAFDSLTGSKAEFRGAMLELDAKFVKNPLTNVKDLESRAQALNVMYRQIAIAQGTKAAKAAEDAWTIMVKKKKDLKSYRLNFWANTVLGTLSVVASVTAAVMSMGTLAVTIISAAKTVLQTANAVYKYCRELSAAEKAIIDTDVVLQETWKEKSNAGKIMGRDLAGALGVPFVKSTASMEKTLQEYNAKSAIKLTTAQKMWEQAQEIMAAIAKIPEDAGKEKLATGNELGKQTTALLDRISEIMASGKSEDQFYSVYSKRLMGYQKLQGDLGRAAPALAPAADLLSKLGGLASTAKTVADIAMKLA